ncbi:hypothetical protein [Methanobrevibacter sp.]
MLEIELKDKIINIRDDEFTRAKVDSIKLIADKYAIKDILDFKLTFTENLFGVSQQSTSAVLNESMSLDEFYEILTGMFDEMEKENSEDFEDISISFEGLFIL